MLFILILNVLINIHFSVHNTSVIYYITHNTLTWYTSRDVWRKTVNVREASSGSSLDSCMIVGWDCFWGSYISLTVFIFTLRDKWWTVLLALPKRLLALLWWRECRWLMSISTRVSSDNTRDWLWLWSGLWPVWLTVWHHAYHSTSHSHQQPETAPRSDVQFSLFPRLSHVGRFKTVSRLIWTWALCCYEIYFFYCKNVGLVRCSEFSMQLLMCFEWLLDASIFM